MGKPIIPSSDPSKRLWNVISNVKPQDKLINDYNAPEALAANTSESIGIVKGSSAAIDHGGLTGLADDDHTQYLLVAGTRAMTGDLQMGGNEILFTEQSKPSNPAATKQSLYTKTVSGATGRAYLLDESGNEHDIQVLAKQVFPAQPWALNDQQGEMWSANIVNAGTVASRAVATHDFTDNESDDVYGQWDTGASYEDPNNNTADFAWAVPWHKFADASDNCRVVVGVRIRVATDRVGATAPDDVLDNVYLGINPEGGAETKADILASIVALDTWYYILLAANGTDVGSWSTGATDKGHARAWVQTVAKRHAGEEPVGPYTFQVDIECLTVEQWVN